MQQKNNQKTLKIMLIILIALLVIVTAIIIVLLLQKRGGYDEKISLGDKYLSEMNYEDAIIAYTQAINIDAKKPDGYVGLVDVYVETEDYDQALVVVNAAKDNVPGYDWDSVVESIPTSDPEPVIDGDPGPDTEPSPEPTTDPTPSPEPKPSTELDEYIDKVKAIGLSGEVLYIDCQYDNVRFYYPVEWKDRLVFTDTELAFGIESVEFHNCIYQGSENDGFFRHTSALLGELCYGYTDEEAAYSDILGDGTGGGLYVENEIFRLDPAREDVHTKQITDSKNVIVFTYSDAERMSEILSAGASDRSWATTYLEGYQELIDNWEIILAGFMDPSIVASGTEEDTGSVSTSVLLEDAPWIDHVDEVEAFFGTELKMESFLKGTYTTTVTNLASLEGKPIKLNLKFENQKLRKISFDIENGDDSGVNVNDVIDKYLGKYQELYGEPRQYDNFSYEWRMWRKQMPISVYADVQSDLSKISVSVAYVSI